MNRKTKMTEKTKILAVATIILTLIISTTILWQRGKVAEAALLDPHPGLVGWWRFDGGTGSTAEDSSGYGNHGTIYGATWTSEGKYSYALNFDGTDDYVEVAYDDSLDLSGDFTLSVWVDPTWYDTGEEDIHSKVMNKKGSYGLWYSVHVDTLRFAWGDGSSWYDGENFYWDVGSKGWLFTVVVFDDTNDEIRFYVNGEQVKSIDETRSIGQNARSLRIGDNGYKGSIDEARAYNRSLSATEIQGIFEQGPDFSSRILAEVQKGTTQVLVTASWQGTGSLNATVESPSLNYTEDMVPVYQKTSYPTSGGISQMLNIKRLSISISALASDEEWYITLDLEEVERYTITIETIK